MEGSWATALALQTLDLSNNELSGPLPDAWGAPNGFRSLQRLQVPPTFHRRSMICTTWQRRLTMEGTAGLCRRFCCHTVSTLWESAEPGPLHSAADQL